MRFPTLPLRRVTLDASDGPFGSSLKSDHYSDAGARVIRLGNIGSAAWIDDDAAYIPLDYWSTLSRHHAGPGDLIVAGLGDEGHSLGRACVLPMLGPALVKADCYRLTLDPAKADARFVAFYLSAREGEAASLRLADGSTRLRLTLDKALSIPVPDAPLVRQRAIVDYLDAETARIDTMIARYSLLLSRLEERRQAAIARILEPGPGEVSVRLKFKAGRPTSGNRDHSFTEDESGVPCLRGLNVKPGRIDRQNLMRISEADHRSHIATVLRSGDIVIVRSGNAGAAAMVPNDLDGANCVDLVVLRRAPAIWPRYLEYALNSHQARSQATEGIFGATLTHFNAVDVAELRLHLPSLPAQQAATLVLDRVTGVIDHLQGLILRQGDLLHERRQALINAAVTGEIEMPGVAA
jgi:type I restriction enzyme S subunit